MGKFILTVENSIKQKLIAFYYSNRPKNEVLDVINQAIMQHTTLGFFERMDLRDWLYSTSVLHSKAERSACNMKFTLIHKNEGTYDTPIAREHTPYFVPRSEEEIMEEHWARKEKGMFRPQT